MKYSLPKILNWSLPKCFYGGFFKMIQNSSKHYKPFWRLRFGRGSVVRPPSNGQGLRDIQHSMSMVLDKRFHIWLILTHFYKIQQILLKNAGAVTEVTIAAIEFYYKMRQAFWYKMQQSLQIATSFLQKRQSLQIATFITNCDSTPLIIISW